MASLPLLLAFAVVLAALHHQLLQPATARQLLKARHVMQDSHTGAHILHRDSPASPFRLQGGSQQLDAWHGRFERDASRIRTLHARASGAPISSGYELAGSGEYFARIGIGGNPVTHRYVIIDTGSDLSWVQCAPCDSCYPQLDKPLFDPATSQTLRNVSCDSPLCADHQCVLETNQCKYEVNYGDQSFTMGNLVSDTITFGTNGANLPNMVFGCGHNNQGTFRGSAGLIGLGSGPLSLPSQLLQQNSNNQSTFSYCLPPMFSSTTSTLTFGGNPLPNASFTKLLLNPIPMLQSFYYVPLTGISVAGVRLPTPPTLFEINSTTGIGGVILDSGTSVTHLNPTAYELLRSAFRDAVAKAGHLSEAEPLGLFDTCFIDNGGNINAAPMPAPANQAHHSHTKADGPASAPLAHHNKASAHSASEEHRQAPHHHHQQQQRGRRSSRGHDEHGVPRVVFHFEGGADLYFPAQNVVTPVDASGVDKRVCLAFTSSLDPFSIIGNVQQQGIRFSFDIAAATLGFAAGQC